MLSAQMIFSMSAAAWAVGRFGVGDPMRLAVFAAAITIFGLVVVRGVAGEVYSLGTACAVASALVLAPGAIPVALIVPAAADALNRRRPWHVAIENWSNFTLAELAAHWCGAALISDSTKELGGRVIVAVGLAAVVFVAINLGLICVSTAAKRGSDLRPPTASAWRLELVMALTGGTMAVLYLHAPLTALLALCPIALLKGALSLPALQHEARTDSKTGLLNMRHFTKVLEKSLTQSNRSGRPLALLVGDLDHFRDINNTYGHLAGDEVIRSTADAIRQVTREQCDAARFGGEEFFVLLPDVSRPEAIGVAERIRLAVADGSSRIGVPTTISFGVASYPDDAEDGEELMKAGDAALYAAKQGGRNLTFSYTVGQLAIAA